MNDQREEYLWDRSGPVDPLVQDLERALSPYGAQRQVSREFLATKPARGVVKASSCAPRWIFALAAGLALALFASRRLGREPSGYAVKGHANLERVHAGMSIEASAQSPVVLAIGALGEVELAAGSRLGVVSTAKDKHALFLERGRLRATIAAEPRVFQVRTPAGVSVDLGCQYDLDVDAGGTTRMRVSQGRVAFSAQGIEVIAPAGTSCEIAPGKSPSIPVRWGADPELVRRVAQLAESNELDSGQVAWARELDLIEDGSSVWNLFATARSSELRAILFERLAAAYPMPAGVDREQLLERQPQAMEAWLEKVRSSWLWQTSLSGQ